jgi:hypothetical protein
VPGEGLIAHAVVNAITDFAEAEVEQLALYLTPNPGLNVLQGMALLEEAGTQAGQIA